MENNIQNKLSVLRRELCRKSMIAFALMYFPHYLKYKLSKAHEDLYGHLERILEKRGNRLVLAAPRKFGKSTHVTLIFVLYCICFRKEHFIVILSNTSSQARQYLDNIKRELNGNLPLLEDFPELKGPRPRPWTAEEIETPNGIRIAVFGSDQNVRGRRFGQHRPTLVIADDIEKTDLNFNAEAKDKLKAWYEQAVLELGNDDTNYLLCGNYFSTQCLMGNYINPETNHAWIKIVYQAIVSFPKNMALWDDRLKILYGQEKYLENTGPEAALAFYKANEAQMLEGYQLLWPERWTPVEMMELYQEHPAKFDAEYQNRPHNSKESAFQYYEDWRDHFRTEEEFLQSVAGQVSIYGACDPAAGRCLDRGDYTGISVVARVATTKRLYMLRCDIERMTPLQIIERIMAYHRKYRFAKFGIEANAFQALLARELRERSLQSGLYIPITELRNNRDKVGRILSLQPLLQTGALKIWKANSLFVEQLIYYPRVAHDDGLDSLEMAVRIAEGPKMVTAKII